MKLTTSSFAKIADLQAIINVVPLPLLVKDREHRIVLINDAACEFTGHSREVSLKFSDYDLFPAEEVEVFRAVDDEVFLTGAVSEIEEQITDAAGRTRTVITRKRRLRLGGADYLVAIITDVTAYREAEAHNYHLAFHDTLTGLPNRALLSERIDQALLRRTRTGERCTLLYVDLDRFKEVNDTYGHQSGDALIQSFASRIAAVVRATDTVSRLGGDEFALLLIDRGDPEDVDRVCERILEVAAEPFDIDGSRVYIGASIGVAEAVDEVDNVEIQRRADVALYQSKREGRNCYRRFTDALDSNIRHLRRLESDLREALATDTQLEVHYQPLFTSSSEKLSGMEALVRWRHPDLGLLPPEEFISVAEETGLIVPLGEWVLESACAMIAKWPDLLLAVNCSPVQLREDGPVDRILEILGEAEFSPDRLELEVTESAILDASEQMRDRLKKLQAAGVKIVLDDFGTGYSSLTHLQKLAVDKVKIDKSFVHDIVSNTESEAIVQAVTHLARVLDIPVTAEGVETKIQHDLLRIIGCTEMQGFLYSQPLSSNEAKAFLADKTKWTRVA
ncbi:MAG: EAL domain-containing protein [Alphaproteobacteria bacterium]|nr:EAL domain-containing protein [Alphaproteobacteria bacterium]|tara:strand:+ start:1327 stop:3015 length:1689 start_codon:yes stop_codon:yes gene_type:complete